MDGDPLTNPKGPAGLSKATGEAAAQGKQAGNRSQVENKVQEELQKYSANTASPNKKKIVDEISRIKAHAGPESALIHANENSASTMQSVQAKLRAIENQLSALGKDQAKIGCDIKDLVQDTRKAEGVFDELDTLQTHIQAMAAVIEKLKSKKPLDLDDIEALETAFGQSEEDCPENYCILEVSEEASASAIPQDLLTSLRSVDLEAHGTDINSWRSTKYFIKKRVIIDIKENTIDKQNDDAQKNMLFVSEFDITSEPNETLHQVVDTVEIEIRGQDISLLCPAQVIADFKAMITQLQLLPVAEHTLSSQEELVTDLVHYIAAKSLGSKAMLKLHSEGVKLLNPLEHTVLFGIMMHLNLPDLINLKLNKSLPKSQMISKLLSDLLSKKLDEKYTNFPASIAILKRDGQVNI